MVPIVDVFTSFAGESAEVLVGTCRFGLRRGRISCSFASRFAAANRLLSLRGNAWRDA